MRYLATTNDLNVTRGYRNKLVRKWVGENGKNRTARVFLVLEEHKNGGFGDYTRGEALRDPGGVAGVILEGKYGLKEAGVGVAGGEVPVFTRVSLKMVQDMSEEDLARSERLLVDLEGSQRGWDFLWAREMSVRWGVRFTGGILPEVDGIKIGLFDSGELEKTSGKGYKGIAWDRFDDAVTVPLEGLDGVTEVTTGVAKGVKRAGRGVRPFGEIFDEIDDDSKSIKKSKSSGVKTKTRASRKASFLDSMF